MARLVQILGVTHTPFLSRLLKNPGADTSLIRTQQNLEMMRDKLAAARPDVLLVVANDHLNQTFCDNMPAFMIGKAPLTAGPFPQEIEAHGLTRYEVSVNTDLANYLISGGFRKGVDFAFSDEFTMDHAFTCPLTWLRPEMDIPIVPLFTNCMAPPMPPAERFYQVGQAVRDLLDEYPHDQRVAVVGTGHLSADVGGPRMGGSACDPEFDHQMIELIARADAEGLIREATFERMFRAGNVTPGFLAFVLALGVARAARPSFIEGVFHDHLFTSPFMIWEL